MHPSELELKKSRATFEASFLDLSIIIKTINSRLSFLIREINYPFLQFECPILTVILYQIFPIYDDCGDYFFFSFYTDRARIMYLW